MRPAITFLPQLWPVPVKRLGRPAIKGVGRKIFRGGPIRMEPVLTTKNGRIFEIWELLERVCENPGGGHGPPLPPLADAHACYMLYTAERQRVMY